MNSNGDFGINNNANSSTLFLLSSAGAATFSNNVYVGGTALASYSASILSVYNSSTGGAVLRLSNSTAGTTRDDGADIEYITGALNITTRETADEIRLNTRDTNRLTIASTGAATFSSSVTAGGGFISNNDSNTPVGFYKLKPSSVTTARWWRITSDNVVYGDFSIAQSSANSDASYTNILYFNAAGAATFSSSVTAGGNLGGTSDYTALTLRNQANGDYYVGLDFSSGTDNGTSSIRSYRTNSSGDYQTALTFWTKGSGAGPTSPSERMRITSGGNVLIGTTTDNGNKLDVVSTPTFSSNGNSTIVSTTNLSVGAGATFNSGGVWAASKQNNLVTWNGSISTTLSNGAVMAGQVSINQHSFAAAGYTITVNQSSSPAIRAIAGLQVLQQTGGSYSGTISHGASLFVQGIYPTNTTTVTFTNYYGLLINPLDEWGFVTLTNRWGIYQAGSSDVNFFGAKVLIGTATAVSGSYKVEVTGSVYASTGFYESSDIRYKNVVATNQSNNFGAISFNWKDGRDSKTHWGYSAQEVQKFLPDAITEGTGGYLAVDYNQAHTYKIQKLEDRVAELESKLKKYEA